MAVNEEQSLHVLELCDGGIRPSRGVYNRRSSHLVMCFYGFWTKGPSWVRYNFPIMTLRMIRVRGCYVRVVFYLSDI